MIFEVDFLVHTLGLRLDKLDFELKELDEIVGTYRSRFTSVVYGNEQEVQMMSPRSIIRVDVELESIIGSLADVKQDIREIRAIISNKRAYSTMVASPTCESSAQAERRLARWQEEEQRVGKVLQTYFQRTFELQERANYLIDQLTKIKNGISRTLRLKAAEFNKAEMTLGTAGFACVAAGMVPATLGMNLTSGLENSNRAFWMTSVALAVLIVVIFALLMKYVKYKKMT